MLGQPKDDERLSLSLLCPEKYRYLYKVRISLAHFSAVHLAHKMLCKAPIQARLLAFSLPIFSMLRDIFQKLFATEVYYRKTHNHYQ
jgi:hypothetical protein